MFSKILIANRGEIACRVIKTARRMGIKTVAVYSEADANALHVEMADEKVLHRPGAVRAELSGRRPHHRSLQAHRRPGGPSGLRLPVGKGRVLRSAEGQTASSSSVPTSAPSAPWATRSSRRSWRGDAGVNTVPGYLGVIADENEAASIARDIGYPVMIKASAGGGGKGMRVAWNDEQAREGFRSASNEARSSFGDDRVFVEKYIEQPRHIEIQVLGDAYGNVLYLGERECSIQRRHQKVIEEAPSPFIDAATRKAMGEQAVALAKAVEYKSAGTVEFIVDANRNFYFLEMNTRLQVEHPVTEMVVGLDLVEQMIRVAAGEKLKFQQSDIELNGWSIEAPRLRRGPDPRLPALHRPPDPLHPAGRGRAHPCRYRRL